MNLITERMLIGTTKDSILTCDLTINSKNEFTMSFNIGNLICIKDYLNEDYLTEYFDDLDNETKINLSEDFSKTKDEIIEDWLYEDNYEMFIDCSCTNYLLQDSNGINYNFETIECGQINNKALYEFDFINKDVVTKLLEYHDKKHLQTLTNDEIEDIKSLIKQLDDFRYKDDIIDYLLDKFNIRG